MLNIMSKSLLKLTLKIQYDNFPKKCATIELTLIFISAVKCMVYV